MRLCYLLDHGQNIARAVAGDHDVEKSISHLCLVAFDDKAETGPNHVCRNNVRLGSEENAADLKELLQVRVLGEGKRPRKSGRQR